MTDHPAPAAMPREIGQRYGETEFLYWYQAEVLDVHDGDTIRLNVDLGFRVHQANMVVRFYGVDAPELGRDDNLGEQAREALTFWFKTHPGPYRILSFRDRTEKFGRYLVAAIQSTDGREAIADQLREEWLKPYTGEGPRPVWP